MKVHYEIDPKRAAKWLGSRSVEIEVSDASDLALIVNKTLVKRLELPMPLDLNAYQVQNHPNLLWIECVVSIAQLDSLHARPDFVFGVRLDAMCVTTRREK